MTAWSLIEGVMAARTCLVIVLAAGEGTRMRSLRPKVLHALAGKSLLAHALSAVSEATAVAVVIGPGEESVAAEACKCVPGADVYVQAERRGTAHAVLAAEAAIARGYDDLLVVFADTPFIRGATLERVRTPLGSGAAIVVLGFRAADPTGYGRLIVEGDKLCAIREQRDATAQEHAITLCNAGVMALDGRRALAILRRIGDQNSKHEFYLSDAVEVARAQGFAAAALETEEDEVRGINTRAQLAEAEGVLQQRLRAAAMEGGATLVAPETVFLAADTKLGRDVIVEPHVVFGPGVVVEDGAVIRSFSHLEGAHVGKGASVGPFARLRPGARLGVRVRVGNFVEVKESTIEAGSKAPHLSYIGNARVGENVNVGAGTITCNYDGGDKHRTDIGKDAFIGSNSSLVAPVAIGEGAYIGSGSVITRDVPAGALAIGRGQQVVKEGWATRFKAKKQSAKKRAHASD
jgi:bifunctional UDP-N-acetylglucosamine pyrophosphorylase/glucosamine-1-phosphate N-acetyltransferase